MEIEKETLLHSLNADEIEVLLRLYYIREGSVDDLFESESIEEKISQSLIDKNLVSTTVDSGENIVLLTEAGLDVCGSVMFNRVKENTLLFRERMQVLPERAIACLVNRVLWRDVFSRQGVFLDTFTKPYALDENLSYERVLLKDDRIKLMLGGLYVVLESLGLIKNVDGQRWCPPEVEQFLKGEYKDVKDLSWSEEDSLKYYFFFYVYAQDQKNLIDFSGDGERFRSMFFGDASPTDYWFSSNCLDPRMLLSNLGVSEKRIIGFLGDMQRKNIVNERYYPLSSFSFFSEDDEIYVITDIKAYMDFIKKQFLTPVVDSLVKTN